MSLDPRVGSYPMYFIAAFCLINRNLKIIPVWQPSTKGSWKRKLTIFLLADVYSNAQRAFCRDEYCHNHLHKRRVIKSKAGSATIGHQPLIHSLSNVFVTARVIVALKPADKFLCFRFCRYHLINLRFLILFLRVCNHP